MAFDGFDEDDYENMRTPGCKMLLTQMDHTSNVVTVISYDDSTQHVTVKYDRNEFQKQHLLDRLGADEFNIDLREYEHQWIDPDQDLYCFACHSLELDHLFVCHASSHEPYQVAFHDRCLDINLGHTIPNNNTARTWKCPMHKNMLQKIDPNSLRKRSGDYDFEFDRPLKKRKLNISDPKWLALPPGADNIYPIHISCQYCYSEGVASQCDGHRPCGNCMQYIQDEVLDMTQEKYLSMNEQELQFEVQREAIKYCMNRNCKFDEFENDISMRHWLKEYNNKLYQSMIQEKREKDQQKEEDEEDEDIDLDINNNNNNYNDKRQQQQIGDALSAKAEEELTKITFDFKQPEFVDSVPIYARYQCSKCDELFGDKYRYQMHELWAHQEVIASKKAKNSKWKVLNHFISEKPLKFACPYSGCLRGANSSEEIEDHILRHHDITDPTKPKEEPLDKSMDKIKNKNVIKRNNKQKNDLNKDDVECVGVGYLSQSEKRKISKIWYESKALPIDRKNRQDLIKNFVSSVVSDNLDKFDKTTKRLQKQYKQNMERIAHNMHNRNNPNNLPPPLIEEPLKEEINQHSGPKSLWQ